MSSVHLRAFGFQMAWIPLPKGKYFDESTCPRAIDRPSDFDAVAYWDDGSIRVGHLWIHGKADERVEIGTASVAPSGDFPITTWIENAVTIDEQGYTCVSNGTSRDFVRDTHFRRVELYESDILDHTDGTAFATQKTYVTSFAGSQDLLIDHSITWARAMRDRRVYGVWFGGVAQWVYTGKPGAWHERPWWHGDVPLGQPLTQDCADRMLTPSIRAELAIENKLEHYLAADLHGTRIRDRWLWRDGALAYPQTGRPSDDLIEAAKILPDAIAGKESAMLDDYAESMFRSFFAKATPGRFTKGNPPRKWHVREDRPVAHRPGIGSYYCTGETLWISTYRGLDLTDEARLMTEHMVQFGQVAAPAHADDTTLDKWHRYPGAMWKLGEPVGNPPDMNESDAWASHFQRSPDPMVYWYAWLFDGDLTASDAFSLWLSNANPLSFQWGLNREGAKTIGMVADVLNWIPHHDWAAYLEQLVGKMLLKPGIDHWPNSLWDPNWIQKALLVLQNDKMKANLLTWARTWRDSMHTTRNQDTEALALSVVAGAPKYLRAHVPVLAHHVLRAEGVGPGALQDAYVARQIGVYVAAIKEHGIPLDRRRTWPIRIPVAQVSFGSASGVQSKGTRIAIATQTNTLDFVIEGIASAGGDAHPCTVVVRGLPWVGDWRFTKGILNPVTGGYRVSYSVPVPGPGKYEVAIGGHGLELVMMPNYDGVVCPAGNYVVRAPNLFRFTSDGSVKVTGQSTSAWIGVNGTHRLTYGQSTPSNPDRIDLVGGSDAVALLTLSKDMVLVCS